MPFPLKYTAFPGGSDSKESAWDVGDPALILGSGRWPGEGNGNPLQYSSWRGPWTEEGGRLQSTGSLTVGHDWGANTFTLMSQAVACQLQACCSMLFVMQDLEFCQPHLSLTSRFPTGLINRGLRRRQEDGGREKPSVFPHFLALAGDSFQSPAFFLPSTLRIMSSQKITELARALPSWEVRTPTTGGFFLQLLIPANFNLFSLWPHPKRWSLFSKNTILMWPQHSLCSFSVL